MRAAVALGNVVGKAKHVLVVAVVPPERDLDGDTVLLAPDGNGLVHQRLLGAIEITDESFQAAIIKQLFLFYVRMTLVGEQNANAGIQKCQFAQAVLERGVIIVRHGEGFGAREEGDFRARAAFIFANDGKRRVGDTMGEADLMQLAVTADSELQPDRERIDHRDAHAMQTAGHLVGILVELSARVQLRHDDFGGGNAFGRVDIGRNAAPVIRDRHRPVGVQRHRHQIGMTGKRLVDGVVDHFVDHVVQAGTVIGITDIHAGPLAHGIKTLEDLDRIGSIFGVRADSA